MLDESKGVRFEGSHGPGAAIEGGIGGGGGGIIGWPGGVIWAVTLAWFAGSCDQAANPADAGVGGGGRSGIIC
jgi:hypothetical protein